MFARASVVLLSALCWLGCATPSSSPPSEAGSPAISSLSPSSFDTGAVLSDAAALVTAETSLRHLSALACDEMMGRYTERPEIWAAARHIAGEFRAMGLEPMDEDGDFIDEYSITIPAMDCGDVRILAEAEGKVLELRCGVDFALRPTVNAPTLESLVISPFLEHGWYREHPDSIPDRSLVLTLPAPMGTIEEGLRFGSWMENVWDAGADAVGMILAPATPPEVMRTIAAGLGAEPTLMGPTFPFLSWEAVEKMFELAGVPSPNPDSLTTLHQAPVRITFHMPVTTRTITAPNVVARLPGSRGRELKEVVLTAHFDHEPPGEPTSEGDSIFNGADDNASGTVGLMEAARAFAALPTPPARSVVFAAVSGEEMGLLGSAHLAENGPAPATSTAANLNMDMLSRNGPDSLFVFGQTYSSLGEVLQTVLKDHPELGFRIRPGIQRPEIDLIRFSDQASYLERGVPALFFHSGFHPELHTPDDEVELADPDKLARVARLVFYLAYAIADDPNDPRWTAEGWARAEGMQRHLNR